MRCLAWRSAEANDCLDRERLLDRTSAAFAQMKRDDGARVELAAWDGAAEDDVSGE